MKKPALQFFVYLLIFSLCQTAHSQGNSIKSFTQDFDKKEGFLNYYWDDTMCWWRKKSVIGSDEDMSLTPLTFENWKSGQPDNTANMENRVVMTGKYDYA